MFANRQLTAVVCARFVSLTGTNLTTVALPWFVLVTTGSTARMGIVLACQTLPAVVLGIPAGQLVARIGPRRSLVLGDALRAPLLAAVPILHAAGALSFPLLLVLVTTIGLFSVPYASAASALLPDLVGENENEVARATAALQVAIQTTGVLGPILAGALIPLVGAANVLLVDAVSYGLSATIVAVFVHAGKARPAAARVRGLFVGLTQIRRDSLLLAILATATAAHVALAGLFASLPALAYDGYHDPRTAGVLFAADAIGSVVGGLAVLALARRVRPLVLGVVGFAAMAAPLWLLVQTTSLPVAVVSLFVFGVGGPLGVAPISAILTTRAPAAIRPQVVATFLSVSSAGTPLGAVLAGYAIEQVGFRATYVGVAAVMTFSTLLLLRCVRTLQRAAAIPATSPS